MVGDLTVDGVATAVRPAGQAETDDVTGRLLPRHGLVHAGNGAHDQVVEPLAERSL
jgi:hypothetical protein